MKLTLWQTKNRGNLKTGSMKLTLWQTKNRGNLKLITNQNVGATSFPFDIANPANFAGAADDFWDAIEHIRQ